LSNIPSTLAKAKAAAPKVIGEIAAGADIDVPNRPAKKPAAKAKPELIGKARKAARVKAEAKGKPVSTAGSKAFGQAMAQMAKAQAQAEPSAYEPEGAAFEVDLTEAQKGKLPTPPDFSAKTHTSYRPKLEMLVKLAKAGDVAGLKNVHLNPCSTSPKAMYRYRALCLAALAARK
jgi:hypothetical protein